MIDGRSQRNPTMSQLKTLLFVFAALASPLAGGPSALAEEATEPANPPRQSWSFSGMFGVFDQAQLQRGFQVYKEVCGACHRLSIPFRALGEPGGPRYSEAQVKALAASYQVVSDEPNDRGEIFKRPGRPSDVFPPPESFRNDQAAAAAFGKAPPDMALLAKALKYERGFPWFIFDALPFDQYQEMGADFVCAILNGYAKPDDPQWNLYYPGRRIAMPQPIADGAVAYQDGAPPTLDRYARDVAAFLSWAAEPTLAERKKIGLRAMIFLFVLAGLLYFIKERVWRDLR